MVILGWAFVIAAIVIQSVNVALLLNGLLFRKPMSQVVIVPCVLWYVGLVVKGSPFFLDSGGVEIAIVALFHLVVAFTSYLVNSRLRGATR